MSVLLGDGNGAFELDSAYPMGPIAVGIAAGDLEGSGAPSLVVPTFDDGAVTILRGLGAGPWNNEGGANPQSNGHELHVSGIGPFTPGSANTLAYHYGPANAFGILVIGTSGLNIPWLDGTLVAFPNKLVGGQLLDANGNGQLDFTWPANAPSGLELWFQHWAVDLGLPGQWAGSNGLRAVTP